MNATHDPPQFTPGVPLDDDAVRMRRPNMLPTEQDALIAERAAVLDSPRYRLLALATDEDPMELIRAMAQGRYRWKRHRSGAPVLTDGAPVPEEMSFRQIERELHRLTGERIKYETLRRWWLRVWPGETAPGEEPAASGVPPVEFRPPAA